MVERNPEYWDAASVGLNEIHFHPIESQETEERAFRAGQLHATSSLPVSKIAVYQQDNPGSAADGATPWRGLCHGQYAQGLPSTDLRSGERWPSPSTGDLLVEQSAAGRSAARSDLQPTGHGWIHFDRSPTRPGIRRTFPALLGQAGYPEGTGFLEIDYLYNTSEGNRNIAEALQEMWRQ